MSTVIMDTGALLALVNRNDQHHDDFAAWFDLTGDDELIIPDLIVTEAGYLIGKALGNDVEAQFLADVAAQGYGRVVAVTEQDLARMSEILRTFADLCLGTADASVIALAERFATPFIASVDERDMRAVKPKHGPLQLLPFDF